MSRFFVPIGQKELSEKILKSFGHDGRLDYNLMLDKLVKDIKVQFDTENFFSESERNVDICGLHTLPSGLTFHGFYAGGDWESPVFFIVYFDGKKLRAYVPTDGNPWNTTTKRAYGNDEKADFKNAQKRYPNSFETIDDFDCSYFDFDKEKIFADITARILISPDIKKFTKSLRERLDELSFKNIEMTDESTELFQLAKDFAHRLNGLGLSDWAETVFRMAAELAAASHNDTAYD